MLTLPPSQGYVTEILLTLEASIDALSADLIFTDHRERGKTGSSRKNDFRKSTSNLYNIAGGACGFDNVKRHSISSAKMMENAASAASNGSSGIGCIHICCLKLGLALRFCSLKMLDSIINIPYIHSLFLEYVKHRA